MGQSYGHLHCPHTNQGYQDHSRYHHVVPLTGIMSHLEVTGTLLVRDVTHIRYGLRQGIKAKAQKDASWVRGQRAVVQRVEG